MAEQMDADLVWNMLFEDDSEDDDEEDDIIGAMLNFLAPQARNNRRHANIEDYVDTVVPRYTPDVFKSHFRLSREVCETLTEVFGPEMYHTVDLPPHHQVLLSLWVMNNPDAFREVADRFGVSKSTAWTCFLHFCKTVSSKANTYIYWPRNLAETKQKFFDMVGFPGVVGCVDGTHIPIPMPSEQGERYVNRKGFASVVLLAVCDDSMRFIYVDAGWAGSVHDARVYRTGLGQLLAQQEERLLEGGHLLGDAAFPCSTACIVPFKDNGHLTPLQRRFNTRLSSTRMTVERAFGYMKGKFRRMKMLNMNRMDLVPSVITTACVLHNISIEGGIGDEEPEDAMAQDAAGAEGNDPNAEQEEEDGGEGHQPEDARGVAKRDNIMQHLA